MNKLLDNSSQPPSGATFLSLRWLVLLLLFNLLIRSLLALTLPILSKETLLWQWGQFPSLGYVEHPPLLAWVMRLCTMIHPENPLLLSRGIALTFGTLTPCLVYWLAKRAFHDDVIAGWAFLLTLCLPALNIVGVLLMPTTILVPLILLSVGFFYRALKKHKVRDWCLSGAMLGLGLLCDLMALLPLIAAIMFLLQRRQRQTHLTSPGPWLALCFTLLMSFPFLYWSFQHNWVSFTYPVMGRHQAGAGFSFLRLGEVLFEQIPNAGMLVIPIIGCLFASTTSVPARSKKAYRLFRARAGVVLILFVLAGCVLETHPHWTVLAYPFAVLCLSVRQRWGKSGWLHRRVRRMTITQISVLTICSCLLSMGPLVLRQIPPEQCTTHLKKKLAKIHETFFPWQELAKQLGDHPMLLTDNEKLAGWVGYHRHNGEVLSIEWLLWHHETSQHHLVNYQQMLDRRGLFFTESEKSLDLELMYLFRHVERKPAIRIRDTITGEMRQFQIYEVNQLRSEVLTKLQRASISEWVRLTKRHPVHVLQVRKTGTGTEVLISGWIGRRETEQPPQLELYVDGKLRQTVRADDPVPDAQFAFQHTNGEEGAPMAECGFGFRFNLSQIARRIQIIAVLPYGRWTLVDCQPQQLQQGKAFLD